MNELALALSKEVKSCPTQLTAVKLLYQTLGARKATRRGKIWDAEKLVQACLSGDQAAFAQIVEHYQAYVFAIILNFVEKSDAPDVAQEVFLQLYHSLSQYEPDNFTAWIGKITVCKAIDWKRSHKRMVIELADIDR